MTNKNKEGLKLVLELKKWCEEQECASCCCADDMDGRCLLCISTPADLDTELIEDQANDLTD